MPGIESSDGTSGRVTRSLRKRLTSVDTDSSRPGTPVLTSLQTLQETVSLTPSKRTTRRTSMSTPVPTPSKGKSRLDVSEVVSSPARRSTRRRSLSVQEQEESTVHPKSKEPVFDVVKEEETTENSPVNKSKGGTRISPRLVSRPRSQTPNAETTHKSPEVSPQVLKHMKHSKVMLKKEHIEEGVSNTNGGTKANKQQEAEKATPQKSGATKILSTPQKEKTPKKSNDEQIPPEKQLTPMKTAKNTPKSGVAKAGLNTSKHNTPSKKTVEESPKGSTFTENNTTLGAAETWQPSPKKRGRPQKLKSVGFNNTNEEEGEKNVFPKTPGLTKSKSYILDSSKPDEDQSINKSECKLDDSHEETENDAIKNAFEDDNETMSTKTPYKLKLNSVESSTPIQNTSTKKIDVEDVTQKDTSRKDCDGSKENFSFPKSWSHSVSGTVNDLAKIDNIESEESAKKKLEEEKAMKKNSSISKSAKKKRHVEDSDEEEMEEDDLLMDDEGEEEENEREKSMFVDDEAMEVAEGEESMDSEERNYLEENEIPVYAESIGSEDTVEDECEEEADEEDAAFVVSDTEEILHEESDSDDVKKSNKKYKRILRNMDSSDEESNSEKRKDDDFCLIVDSSIEENTSVKGKFDKTGNAETLDVSRKSVKQESNVSEEEKSLEPSETHRDKKSPQGKKEEIEVSSDDDENTMEPAESRNDDNNDVMEVADEELSDEKMSKQKRKSTEVEKQSTIVVQEDSVDKHVDEDESENVHKSKENTEEGAKDKDTEQLSKKERKSLLSLTNRKSLMVSENKDVDREEDKSMNVSLRRKSLKEGEPMEDNGINEIKVDDKDADTEVTTVKISNKERKSLNKSDVGEIKNSPYKRKSYQKQEEEPGKDTTDHEMEIEDQVLEATPSNVSLNGRKSFKSQVDENKTSSLCSPLKRKSLQKQEVKEKKDVSSSEMETEDKDTETNTDSEVLTTYLPKKERKSLKSQADENENSSFGSPFKRKSLQNHDVEAMEDANGSKRETESIPDIESSVSKLSKKERKSLNKSQSDENKNTSMCSPFKRKSLKIHEEDSMEEAQDTETGTNIETSTSKLSMKKRTSLNKSQADENQNSFMCSPLKQKSLKTDKAETPMKSSLPATPIKSDMQDSGRKLSKKERKSLVDQELVDQDSAGVDLIGDAKPTGNEKPAKTPTKEIVKNTRISLKKNTSENNNEEDIDKDIESKSSNSYEQSQNASMRETESDLETEHDVKAQKNSSFENNNYCTPKSPKEKKKSPLEQLHKSWYRNDTTDEDSDGVSEQSDDSSNSNQHQTKNGGENKLLDDLKNSLNSLKNKKKSMNDSQHKLDRSKLERSVLFVEDDASDEAETTSAFESSRVSEEKSRNSSKISRKSFNQTISSPRISDKTASPRKIHEIGSVPNADRDSENDKREEEKEILEDQESDREANEENVSDMSKVMEFLGEEEGGHSSSPNLNSTRRKSLNKSKLDETFHLESNNNSVLSILHRSVLKKSLNRSKILSESMTKAEEKCDNEEDSGDITDAEFSAEEEIEVVKKVLPDKGLSVSLSGIEKKKKSKGAGEQIHKSFTIGVSLHTTAKNGSPKSNSISSSESAEQSSNDSLSEKDDLEKIENVQVAGPYKPRNSLSKIDVKNANGSPHKSKSKRFSMYVSGEGASQSFVENLAEEKKKLHSKRSRKSNSFCGVSAPCEEPEEAQPDPVEAHKSETQSSETLKSDTKTDIQRILSRCDEILEAANQAKREAKLNAKKTKVKKPKWMDKEEKVKEEEEVKIPLVSKKELKRKEKMRKELAKAIKHSTAMLKTIDPKLIKEIKTSDVKPERVVTEELPIISKRLPTDFLDELEAPKPKKKKTKEIETTPPSDKENSKRTTNKTQPREEGTYETEKKKKKRSREVFETASGTVIVEPVTPSKLKFQNGFRESPKTPVGFKIQDIDSDKDKIKKKAKKLFAASGTFGERDASNSKTHSKKSKKRKFQVEEPVYSLPKTQWTSSGVFIEEDVHTVHHPLANSTATQFMVSSLGGSKKSKSKPVSSTTLSTALNFKKNALFSDKVKREPARNLIHRKERTLVNNRY